MSVAELPKHPYSFIQTFRIVAVLVAIAATGFFAIAYIWSPVQ